MSLQEAILKVQHGEHLARNEAREVMEHLLTGSASEDETVALLLSLRDKGEQAAELIGFAEVMRWHAQETLRGGGVDIEALSAEPLLDTCGTGGDGRGTFNVSTAAALVAAGAGARVAKHGNRSISSRVGSADVLEALGVRVTLPMERIPACLEEVGMVFLFAPHLHVAMKHVMPARRRIKTKTVFNLLGPLTNPLAASMQLAGLYDAGRTEMMAEALGAVGTRRALVVAGADGLDEITTTGPTKLSDYHGDGVKTREITPEDFGLPRTEARTLAGGSAAENARLLTQILQGEKGPARDCVLANSAAALVAAGRASQWTVGVELAAEAIDSGAALRVLERLIEFTRRHG